MSVFFTSDQHFGHSNILKYCPRPFSDLEDMKIQIIERYNSVVKPEDTVFHLGDFSMHPRELIVLSRLNGEKHLICGNHDHVHPMNCKSQEKKDRVMKVYLDSGFSSVQTEDALLVSNAPFEKIVLHHMPYVGDHTEAGERFSQWRPKDEGNWLLHGHVHQHWKVKVNRNQINVGVDVNNFYPVSLDSILEIIR